LLESDTSGNDSSMREPTESSEPFAALVTALVAFAMLAGFIATIADLGEGPRLGVFAMFGWLVVLLPIHEGGHALAARLVGAEIERFVLGYGPVVFRRWVAGVDVVVHAFPVQGFVSIADFAHAPRSARIFVYAAGVAAEAVAVGVALLFVGDAMSWTGSISVERAVAMAGVTALTLSVVANLIPRVALRQPNGEGGEVNDGRRILEAILEPTARR